MKTYEFSIILKSSDLTDEECDRLCAAGCDDGTIVTREGVTSIVFDRESQSLEEAIRSATANIRSAGFDVAQVVMEPDTLVTKTN